MPSASTSTSTGTPHVHAKKDASHAAFYAGFLKGVRCAIDGIKFFITTPAMTAKFRDMIGPLCNAQAVYFLLFTASFFILSSGQPQTLSDFYHGLNRWSRTLTIILSFVVDKHRRENEYIFYESFDNHAFGNKLKDMPYARSKLRAYFNHAKRLFKITLYKSAGAIIKFILPGGHYVVVPVVRFMTMLPTLGLPFAAVIASVHLLPVSVLQSSSVDDFLLSFGEAVVDADECGVDLLKRYLRKLQPDTRDYFVDRYRAYIIGFGFVNSLFSSIPFVGIPFALVSESGAACLISDITARNLEKNDRVELPGEEELVKEGLANVQSTRNNDDKSKTS